LDEYFCRINLSIAESASSASNGMGGFVFVGLYIRFDAMLPTRFMFYDKLKHLWWLGRWSGSHFDLFVRPGVHTQRFHFRDVCSQLTMEGGAPHAEKYTQLNDVNT